MPQQQPPARVTPEPIGPTSPSASTGVGTHTAGMFNGGGSSSGNRGNFGTSGFNGSNGSFAENSGSAQSLIHAHNSTNSQLFTASGGDTYRASYNTSPGGQQSASINHTQNGTDIQISNYNAKQNLSSYLQISNNGYFSYQVNSSKGTIVDQSGFLKPGQTPNSLLKQLGVSDTASTALMVGGIGSAGIFEWWRRKRRTPAEIKLDEDNQKAFLNVANGQTAANDGSAEKSRLRGWGKEFKGAFNQLLSGNAVNSSVSHMDEVEAFWRGKGYGTERHDNGLYATAPSADRPALDHRDDGSILVRTPTPEVIKDILDYVAQHADGICTLENKSEDFRNQFLQTAAEYYPHIQVYDANGNLIQGKAPAAQPQESQRPSRLRNLFGSLRSFGAMPEPQPV